jgi:hypothetical protein
MMPRIHGMASTVPQGNYIVLLGACTDVWQEYHVISSTCSLEERNEHPKDLHNNAGANENMNVDAMVISFYELINESNRIGHRLHLFTSSYTKVTSVTPASCPFVRSPSPTDTVLILCIYIRHTFK